MWTAQTIIPLYKDNSLVSSPKVSEGNTGTLLYFIHANVRKHLPKIYTIVLEATSKTPQIALHKKVIPSLRVTYLDGIL